MKKNPLFFYFCLKFDISAFQLLDSDLAVASVGQLCRKTFCKLGFYIGIDTYAVLVNSVSRIIDSNSGNTELTIPYIV